MQTQLGAEFVCIVSGLQGKWWVDSPGLLLQAVWPQAPAECCLPLPALALFVRQRGFHNPQMMVGLPLVLSLAVHVDSWHSSSFLGCVDVAVRVLSHTCCTLWCYQCSGPGHPCHTIHMQSQSDVPDRRSINSWSIHMVCGSCRAAHMAHTPVGTHRGVEAYLGGRWGLHHLSIDRVMTVFLRLMGYVLQMYACTFDCCQVSCLVSRPSGVSRLHAVVLMGVELLLTQLCLRLCHPNSIGNVFWCWSASCATIVTASMLVGWPPLYIAVYTAYKGRIELLATGVTLID